MHGAWQGTHPSYPLTLENVRGSWGHGPVHEYGSGVEANAVSATAHALITKQGV